MDIYTAQEARQRWIEKKVAGLRSEEKQKLKAILITIKEISEDQEDCSTSISVDNFGFSESVRSVLEYMGYNVKSYVGNEYSVSWRI